jgi:hypothetical protein
MASPSNKRRCRPRAKKERSFFAVALRPTNPGKHPINGLFRVSYIHDSDEMAIVSPRLIASVTGTE